MNYRDRIQAYLKAQHPGDNRRQELWNVVLACFENEGPEAAAAVLRQSADELEQRYVQKLDELKNLL
jgi:hypothetical protein